MRLNFIIYFVLIFSNLNAQTFEYSITGTINDSLTLLPISNANIIIQGTKFGAVSNDQGYYSINFISKKIVNKIQLQFSHLAYQQLIKEFIPKPVNNINVFLSVNILELPEIKIFGVPQIVYTNKEFHLFDYEIHRDTIFLIVYEKR